MVLYPSGSIGIYLIGWLFASAIALLLFLRAPGRYTIGQRRYWHFLTEPWKLLAFIMGAALITLVAPYTGDPTWDHVDGAFMSLFCYTTAPWVVGVLYLGARGRAGWRETYVAVCAWLFSASWSYDGYLLLRDGTYPATWSANLFASSVIYLSAGLFWNLEWQPGRGVMFSFTGAGWPRRAETSSPWRMMIYALIFALPAIMAVGVFLF